MLSNKSKATLSEKTLDEISKLILNETGILLTKEKSLLTQSRVQNRLNETGVSSFEEYFKLVSSNEGKGEKKKLISAITTNVSNFFREPHHYDLLLEHIISRKKRNKNIIKIWSAGCAKGQEAYSIKMHLQGNIKEGATDVKILATDIDLEVLQFAKTGTYTKKMLNGVPQKQLEKWFKNQSNEMNDRYEICSQIKQNITFKHLNLISTWPTKGPFDAIFCRNVAIYFSEHHRQDLWRNFSEVLQPNGLLFLGHSERISDSQRFGLKSVAPTTYRLNQTHGI